MQPRLRRRIDVKDLVGERLAVVEKDGAADLTEAASELRRVWADGDFGFFCILANGLGCFGEPLSARANMETGECGRRGEERTEPLAEAISVGARRWEYNAQGHSLFYDNQWVIQG